MNGQMRKDVVLAMVSQSMNENTFAKIEVYDNINAKICHGVNKKLFVYDFDSLVTNIRES